MLPRVRSSGSDQRSRSVGAMIVAGAAVIAVAVISFLPLHEKLLLHTKGRLHFWGHTGAFALISFLLVRTARSGWGKLWMFLCVFALGCGIEFGQHAVYHEAVEWLDVLVDWIGILFGTMLTLIER